MKSPYRKGVQLTQSNAAIQAAAVIIGGRYGGVDANTASRVVSLAAQIIDEIEIRGDALLRSIVRDEGGEDQEAA